MGGGGKRKSGGAGEGPPNRRKRKRGTAVLNIPTRKEESPPPNSDTDEPQLDYIVKVELEPGAEPERDDDHQEIFEDPSDKELASVDPDSNIDVGDVILMRPPKVEPMFEDEDHGQMDSNTISEMETPGIDIEASSGGNGHASSSASKPSEGIMMMSPTECRNDTGATTGDENNETTSTFSSESNGNPLLNEMTGEREGTTRTDDNNDTTAVTIDSQHFIEEITAADEVQEILPRSEDVNDEVLKNLIGVSEKNVENLSNMQKTDADVITRPTAELKAATEHIELLQGREDSENFRNDELSNQIKQSEEADKKKTVDLERQTSEARLKKEEHKKLALENSTTVGRLPGELNTQHDMLIHIVSEKDEVIRRMTDEIGGLNEATGQLDTEKGRPTNAMITKLASENKRLQDDNSALRKVIAEKDKVILKRTAEVEGLQEDLKIMEDISKGHKAELDKAIRKIDLLQNSISEKDSELTVFRARYLKHQEQNSQLHLAVKDGDEESVKELIRSGASVNARNNNSDTPILLAASNSVHTDTTLRIIKSLIKHGADHLATDKEGQTFLHKLVSTGIPLTPSKFYVIAAYLASNDMAGLFNLKENGLGRTPLMLYAINGELDMATISLLQTNGVDLDLVDNHGRAYLYYATEGNRNVNILNRDESIIKHKSLMQAVKDEDEDSVKKLVRMGVHLNEKNSHFETPLHLAAKSKNRVFAFNTVKLLIDSGANVDSKDRIGRQIFLRRFLEHCRPNPREFHEFVSFLICKDLCRLFNTPGDTLGLGTSIFYWALYYVEIETATMSLLKANGVDFNWVDCLGRSVLYCAIFANNTDTTLRMISDLVSFGANPLHLTNHGDSMLHVAAAEGRVDLLEFFLGQELDVNARNNAGETPLRNAVFPDRSKNILETVQFLLRKGANLDIVDEKGKSSRDYIIENRGRHPDLEQICSTCFSLVSSF